MPKIYYNNTPIEYYKKLNLDQPHDVQNIKMKHTEFVQDYEKQRFSLVRRFRRWLSWRVRKVSVLICKCGYRLWLLSDRVDPPLLK